MAKNGDKREEPEGQEPEVISFIKEIIKRYAQLQLITHKLHLTIKEAATLTGLPVPIIYYAVKRGVIPAIKIGTYRVSRDYMMKFDPDDLNKRQEEVKD